MLSNLLIYCEGEKTEPNYFRSFRIAREVVGEGYNTLSLVKKEMRLLRYVTPPLSALPILGLPLTNATPKQRLTS